MNVLIAAGSSGGHLYPGIALAEYLCHQKTAERITIVVSPQAHPMLVSVKKSMIDYRSFPDIRLAWRLSALLSLLKSFVLAIKLIVAVKPSVVVGFGSYISFPIVVMAKLSRIPVVLHEQNCIFGKTNRLLTRCADRIAYSFPTTDIRGLKKKPVMCTGNLIRSELIEQAALQTEKQQKAPQKKVRILVLGGSQGARFINDIVVDMIDLLTTAERARLAFEHVTGPHDYERIQTRYSKHDIEHHIFSFYNKMGTLYSNADVVISRAGSGTLFELMCFGVPAILIPYPYAEQHQWHNAAYVRDKKAALLLEQAHLTPARLQEVLFELLHDTSRLHEMRAASKALFPHTATVSLAYEVLKGHSARSTI